jgi:riboflavin kinase/FMN adenylyltransferase
MEILKGSEEATVRELGPVALTMGTFDGVHRGHEHIIGQMKDGARRIGGSSVVVTFDYPPRRVLSPDKPLPLLTTPEQKLCLLERLAIDYCMVIPFTERIAVMSGEDFFERYVLRFMDVRLVYVGPGFTFGRDRSGDAALLRRMGGTHGFEVREVAPLIIEGSQVSSTMLRNMVDCGALERIRIFLGRPFSVSGEVVGGKRLGRRIGVPTANIDTGEQVVPPAGVYAVRVRYDNAWYGGVLNVDWNGGVEVHIFNFSGSLYGKRIEAVFVAPVREERTFRDFDSMQKQIRRDIEIAGELLHNEGVRGAPRIRK